MVSTGSAGVNGMSIEAKPAEHALLGLLELNGGCGYGYDLAKRFADGLEAAGGTEMLPALKAALVDDGTGPAMRQVVFLTDGDLSNEREMMAEIAAHGGKSRVFMVGIGSAPNNYLMRRMAEFPAPTFAVAHGACLGVGLGLIAGAVQIISALAVPRATAAPGAAPTLGAR